MSECEETGLQVKFQLNFFAHGYIQKPSHLTVSTKVVLIRVNRIHEGLDLTAYVSLITLG